MKRISILLALGVLAVGLPSVAKAADTVIDFDDRFGFIPATYRSNAPNTPDIGVSYRSIGSQIRNYLNLSVSDYGDLVNVAQPVSEFDQAEIKFTPANGASITLTSFDMAGWPTADYTADVIEIVDSSNTVLWTPSDLSVLGAGPSHSAFSVNVTSSVPIIIRFGNSYNLGIDNIRISQSSAPEPGSLALVVPCLLFGVVRRRRG